MGEAVRKHTVLKVVLYLFCVLSIGTHVLSIVDSIQAITKLKNLEENKHGEE